MSNEGTRSTHDLLIIGAGPVGLALALALKDAGLDIVLADARPRTVVSADPRDLALAHGSRLTLQRLGVWDAMSARRHAETVLGAGPLAISEAGWCAPLKRCVHGIDSPRYVMTAVLWVDRGC